MPSNNVIGIDLGTTFSLAARSEDGTPVVIRDEHGAAQVPSVICFNDDGTVLVGSEARKRALSDPDHTVYSVKRLMGRTLDELQTELELIPYQVVEREVEADRKVLHVKIAGREYTPEELSAMILRELRQRAGSPDKAVITVPAYFDDSQRQATRDAGRIAGLDVLRIVNEPTAAALAYGLQNKNNATIAVYDLGGGTFDCSILSLSDGVFKVLATNGDTFLGGDDFDRAIMGVVAEELGVDLNAKDAELLQHLRDQAERVKIALSDGDSADFVLKLRDIDYRRTFNREEFESLIAPLIDRTLQKCRQALRDAERKPSQIDEAVLVGGSTRIPLVRRKVAEFFGRQPHCDLNPDEVVALGAAVQADILAGTRKSMLLLDVVPLSLGIETLGGVVDKVIHRNTTIPARATARYSTGVDNQNAVLVKIYQGERELTKDCRYLGEFKLSGIPPMPAQMPQVDVTFLVDANGILTVSAKEQRSGQQAQVTVKPGHGLNKDEVEQMVRDSIDYAQEDFTQRRLIELRNKAEGDLKHTEKALAEAGGRLDAETRSEIDTAAANLREAVKGEDVDLLHNRVDELGNATLPLAHLLMDAVAKGVLEGRTPDKLDD